MAQAQGVSSSASGRLDGSCQRTAVVAGDFAIGAGWGTTASLAMTAGATDQRGTVTITTAGTGQAQATATIVLTFADGAYAAAPKAVIVTTDNTNSLDTGKFTWSCTTTALTLTHSLLPVVSKVYTVHYMVVA